MQIRVVSEIRFKRQSPHYSIPVIRLDFPNGRCQVAGKTFYYRLTVSLSVVFHTALLVAAYILPMPDPLPFLWIWAANGTKDFSTSGQRLCLRCNCKNRIWITFQTTSKCGLDLIWKNCISLNFPGVQTSLNQFRYAKKQILAGSLNIASCNVSESLSIISDQITSMKSWWSSWPEFMKSLTRIGDYAINNCPLPAWLGLMI